MGQSPVVKVKKLTEDSDKEYYCDHQWLGVESREETRLDSENQPCKVIRVTKIFCPKCEQSMDINFN